MRRHISGWILAGWMTALCGCQSWSQLGQGIPGGARVPPPGTGTYQVPSSYYNNGAGAKASPTSTSQTTGAAAAQAHTVSSPTAPSTGTGATTADWQMPTVDQMRTGLNNTAAAALNNVSNQANQVVQAGTSRAAAAVDQYATPILTSNPPVGAQASRSLSDQPEPTADEPQLNWQPPK